MIAFFNYGFTIEMTKREAASAHHPGPCGNDVDYLLTLPKIKRQLKKISDKNLISELRGYGAWTKEQLQDRKENEARIIWIAAGDIMEGRRF